MNDLPQTRLTALEELAQLADSVVGPDSLARQTAQWQRLLLGKLTQLLLDEHSKLTGAELRQLLGAPPVPRPERADATGAKLPPAFSEMVRRIYGVSLKNDGHVASAANGPRPSPPETPEPWPDEHRDADSVTDIRA